MADMRDQGAGPNPPLAEPEVDRGAPDEDAALPPDAGPGGEGVCDGEAYLPPVEERCDWEDPDSTGCPEGYECMVIANTRPDAVAVCVAPDCVDIDKDGHGVGPACDGADCNDCDPLIHDGAAERCNGLDDNCNGVIDEDLGESNPLICRDLGVCERAAPGCRGGAWSCGYPATYEEVETRCDGLDNDCDGRVDNVEGLGGECTVGEGACTQRGVFVCDGITGERACSARPLEPVAERCNSIDDDCNGLIDDVPGVGEACTLTSGACESAGVRVCDPVAGQLVCNAQPPEIGDEVCDGRDNDCDGAVDEERDIGRRCDPIEVCNNRDDDGDDQVDEGIEEPCMGQCGAGVRRCIGGQLQACNAPNGGPEACNALDDDCDGRIDEGLAPNRCGTCGEVPDERCGNGIDEDCDGVADEAGVCGRCAGLPDGTELSRGAFGPCEGFADTCAEDGLRRSQREICEGGAVRQDQVEEACRRNTDGVACRVDGVDGRCSDGVCECTPSWTPWRCDGDDRRVREDGCGEQDTEQCVGGRACNRDRAICECVAEAEAFCDGNDRRWRDSCGQAGALIERCQHGCRNGECEGCVSAWTPWRCDGPDRRERDDGCGQDETEFCAGGRECNRGVCECRPQADVVCSGDDRRWQDSCEQLGGFIERCEHGCRNGECEDCVSAWTPWRCDGPDRRERDDGCGDVDNVACGAGQACNGGVCAACCEVTVSPREGSWTADFVDTTACSNFGGGGFLYQMTAEDISYENRNGAVIALVDIRIRKAGDGGNVSADTTVWIVTAGDGQRQMRCADRHAYEHRRYLDNRIVQETWRANTASILIRDVPIWPQAACSSLADGEMKTLGVITDDSRNRGQRIWMSQGVLTFTKHDCN